MNRDLSDVFIEDHKAGIFEDFDDEEAMILPISMDETVVFKFDEKLNNFDFDSERDKAVDMAIKKISEDQFQSDLNDLKILCNNASPSKALKGFMLFCAISLLMLIGMFFIIIWIVLILDLVILAGEIYILKKFKKFVWTWKSKKLDKGWVLEIEKILEEFNGKHKPRGLEWKFETDGKWIQLSSYKVTR